MGKFYLKATGSTCYDETGITFPEKKEIDLQLLLILAGAGLVRWERQFGWSNQPKVLVFDYRNIDQLDALIEYKIYPLGLLVREYWATEIQY